jgi:hypothetical protein
MDLTAFNEIYIYSMRLYTLNHFWKIEPIILFVFENGGFIDFAVSMPILSYISDINALNNTQKSP